jgi:pilus assembly protein CpaB
MQRRIIAAVAAVLLAGIGAVLLYSYVNTAEARAMSKMETTDVLVATKVIPAGTTGSSIAPFVELKKIPAIAVVPGALTNTTDITDLAAITDVQIGEQILPTRFAAPDTTSTGEVDVPTNMQQVSIPLEAPRAVGAQIKPGDKVGVFLSGDDKKNEDKLTALKLRGVLVVKVQGGTVGNSDDTAAPSGTLVVTLALKPADATRVVYGIENARIWLALEPKDGGNSTYIFNSRTVLQ